MLLASTLLPLSHWNDCYFISFLALFCSRLCLVAAEVEGVPVFVEGWMQDSQCRANRVRCLQDHGCPPFRGGGGGRGHGPMLLEGVSNPPFGWRLKGKQRTPTIFRGPVLIEAPTTVGPHDFRLVFIQPASGTQALAARKEQSILRFLRPGSFWRARVPFGCGY